jgi:hypothetical protein
VAPSVVAQVRFDATSACAGVVREAKAPAV